MANSVYTINKAVNSSIEFHGLKSQYIWYFCAGLGGCLVLFAMLYVAGINSLMAIGVAAGVGIVMTIKIYSLSNRYGEHGLMKKMAQKRVPKAIRSYSRQAFMELGKISR